MSNSLTFSLAASLCKAVCKKIAQGFPRRQQAAFFHTWVFIVRAELATVLPGCMIPRSNYVTTSKSPLGRRTRSTHVPRGHGPRGTGTLVGMAPPLNEPCLFMERKRCRLQTLLRLASGSQLKSDTQRHTISKRAFPSFQRCIARCLGPSARQMLVEAVWCYACPVALLCNANVADCTRCCVWHLSHS